MSHEFRTPLNAILGFSELLLHGAVGKLTGQQEEYLRVVEASGRHLLSLLGQVLQMSRLHAGKAQVAVDACAPLSVLDVAMPRLAALAARAGVRFESKVDEAIPAFMGDAAVTAQALTLIIENAVRFSPKKGLVTVEAEARGSEVRFIVSDEGCGIPETEREMVFEPFYQVGRTHTRQTGGTGLGLTIARRLMDAQSGSIRLESREPRGTRVVLSLPRAPEAEYEPVSALGH